MLRRSSNSLRFEIVDHQMADVLRKKTEAERLQIAWSMWRSARRMITRIVSQQMPAVSIEEVEREVAK